ncbi:MAG: 4a-hydroxytetrahydrobiopterin dehydratase [Candidatus Dojkabacteria bacterium]|nr:MAG: 4a-hydroxytetrahydrobiopterin dehydratase [Candidatus Dojkabacteria bacterium]
MWIEKANKLEKEFKFDDFKDAFAFLVQVALVAEKFNHHPEIYNVYNRVVLKITTHDQKKLTSKDFELAQAIDGLLTKK